MNASISRQLILWLAVPLTLLALASALVHHFNTIAPQVISADHRLRAESAALQRAVANGDAASVAFLPADRAIRYAVRRGTGELVAGDADLPPPPRLSSPGPAFTTLELGPRTLRLLSFSTGSGPGRRIAMLADELPAGEPAARYGFMSTLLWDFVQLDVTLVLVWVGIRAGLRPLRRLREEIAARSPRDLRPLPEASAPPEVAPLVTTLNRLFTLLRSKTQAQQSFIADTAHQLRTPLTGMLAQLELLRADPAAAPLQERLERLQEGVRQLSRSTHQLLSLARTDAAASSAIDRHPVDLADLAANAVSRFIDRALRDGIDLGAALSPAVVPGNAALLDDLLNNLIDNALKYTPRGGHVTVSTGSDAVRTWLSVEDDGPGIPAADRQRVRQRYVRLPNSAGHGTGLGLAISDEIARLHDAELQIESGDAGSGTRIRVVFT